MKTKMMSLLIVMLLIGITSIQAQNIKTKTLEAKGKCGMCETRIEKAAKSVDGVTKAEWDKQTQMVTVTFDSEKTDVDKIQKAIADVGHDTEKYKADDNVYNALPGCCKYR